MRLPNRRRLNEILLLNVCVSAPLWIVLKMGRSKFPGKPSRLATKKRISVIAAPGLSNESLDKGLTPTTTQAAAGLEQRISDSASSVSVAAAASANIKVSKASVPKLQCPCSSITKNGGGWCSAPNCVNVPNKTDYNCGGEEQNLMSSANGDKVQVITRPNAITYRHVSNRVPITHPSLWPECQQTHN